MTPVPINTDAELVREMRGLVDWLMEYADHPNLWPLEDCDRVHFVRGAIARAKFIRDSEPFLRGSVVKALDEFKKSKRKKRP